MLKLEEEITKIANNLRIPETSLQKATLLEFGQSSTRPGFLFTLSNMLIKTEDLGFFQMAILLLKSYIRKHSSVLDSKEKDAEFLHFLTKNQIDPSGVDAEFQKICFEGIFQSMLSLHVAYDRESTERQSQRITTNLSEIGMQEKFLIFSLYQLMVKKKNLLRSILLVLNQLFVVRQDVGIAYFSFYLELLLQSPECPICLSALPWFLDEAFRKDETSVCKLDSQAMLKVCRQVLGNISDDKVQRPILELSLKCLSDFLVISPRFIISSSSEILRSLFQLESKLLPLGQSMDDLLALSINCFFPFISKFTNALNSEFETFKTLCNQVLANKAQFPSSTKALLALIWELVESQEVDEFEDSSDQYPNLVNPFVFDFRNHFVDFLLFEAQDQRIFLEQNSELSPFAFLSLQNDSMIEINPSILNVSGDQTQANLDESEDELEQNDQNDLWESEQLWYLSDDYTPRYFALNILENSIRLNADLGSSLLAELTPLLSDLSGDYVQMEQKLRLFSLIISSDDSLNISIPLDSLFDMLSGILVNIDVSNEYLFLVKTLLELLELLLKKIKETDKNVFTQKFRSLSEYLCTNLQQDLSQYSNTPRIRLISEHLKALISTFYSDFIPLYQTFAISFLNSPLSIVSNPSPPPEQTFFLQNSLDILSSLEQELSNPDLSLLICDDKLEENLKEMRKCLGEHYSRFLVSALTCVPESTLQVLLILQTSPSLNAAPLLPVLLSSFKKCVFMTLLPPKQRPLKVDEFNLSELSSSFMRWLTSLFENTESAYKSNLQEFIFAAIPLLKSPSFQLRSQLYSLCSACLVSPFLESLPLPTIISKCVDDLFYSGLDFDPQNQNLALANNSAHLLSKLIESAPGLFSSSILRKITSKVATIFRTQKQVNSILGFSLSSLIIATLSINTSGFLLQIRFLFKPICASLTTYSSTSEVPVIVRDTVVFIEQVMRLSLSNSEDFMSQLDALALSFFFVMIVKNCERFPQVRKMIGSAISSSIVEQFCNSAMFSQIYSGLPNETQQSLQSIFIKRVN